LDRHRHEPVKAVSRSKCLVAEAIGVASRDGQHAPDATVDDDRRTDRRFDGDRGRLRDRAIELA
jgi:hypothetical protein